MPPSQILIRPSTPADLPELMTLYDLARAKQAAHNIRVWPDFSEELLLHEIADGERFTLSDDEGEGEKFLGSFTIAFSDPLIWGEHDLRTYAKPNTEMRALYLHRIATMPEAQGQDLFAQILEWAETYASKSVPPIERLRMDTVGDNPRLTAYYVKHGFTFLGLTKLTNTAGLHDNYSKDVISLYERVLI